MKVIGSLALGSALVDPKKSIAIVVATRELLELSNPAATALFNSELLKAVVAATDSNFLITLVAATTPILSAGSSLANIVTDLAALLTAVSSGPNSKFFFIIDPTNAKKLALKSSSTGAPAFPGLGPNGGEIMPGLTELVSDQLPPGTALMLAADGIAGFADIVAFQMAHRL